MTNKSRTNARAEISVMSWQYMKHNRSFWDQNLRLPRSINHRLSWETCQQSASRNKYEVFKAFRLRLANFKRYFVNNLFLSDEHWYLVSRSIIINAWLIAIYSLVSFRKASDGLVDSNQFTIYDGSKNDERGQSS